MHKKLGKFLADGIPNSSKAGMNIYYRVVKILNNL